MVHVLMIYMYMYIYMQGGEGVTDEMCLSFITYYPAVGIIDCLSQFDPSSINPFINRYIG